MATKASTKFTKAVNAYTGNGVQRNLKSTDLTYVNNLMKESYAGVVSDLATQKPATLAAWEHPINGLNSATHVDDLIQSPSLASKIKNSPHPDTCIIFTDVDVRIRKHFNWVEQPAGTVRDSAVWYLGDKAYVIPAVDADYANNAALAHAQWQSRTDLDQSTGTCSNASYINRTSCEANSETWNSTIDPAELSDLLTKYTNELNNIT